MIRKGWNGKWGQEKELKPKPGYEDVSHQLCHTCQDYRYTSLTTGGKQIGRASCRERV